MSLKPEIYSTLPTVEQFQKSVSNFVNAIDLIPNRKNGELTPSVFAYVDPFNRKAQNRPPWYALLPIGTYTQTLSSRDKILVDDDYIHPAEFDKLNDGGVIYTDNSQSYELVRVDYFSKPDADLANSLRFNNENIIANYCISAPTRVVPGFYIETLEDVYPFRIKVCSKPSEINSVGYAFSNLIEGVKIEDPLQAFQHNMHSLVHGLDGEDLKTVALSSAKMNFMATDAFDQTKRYMPFWNVYN